MRNRTSGYVYLVLALAVIFSSNRLAYGQHHEEHQKHAKHGHEHNGASISVVATLPSYASVAEEIGGKLAAVQPIVAGNQDAHFVQPKPSYALMLQKADLFITTGLDLELWVPTLIDKARNKNVFEGAVGYISAAMDVPMLDKPVSNPDRSQGDVHIYGNPHIHTSPLNAKIIAENILIGLKKVSPEHSSQFEANYNNFVNRIDRALFGDELVNLLGGDVLSKMLMSGNLISFLGEKEFGGEKLISKLDGWLQRAMPLRGRKIIAYHKNWAYFERDFGVVIVDYIEPKPGIPPTAKHVKEIIEKIENQKIQVMIVANYFEQSSPNMIAERTGVKAVFIPFDVGGEADVDDYFDLVNFWIDKLNEAFEVAWR